MKTFYTSEENTLILISLLKSHGIKRIIASPGTTNISFVLSVQNDSYFEVFSAVDERSAAFTACGLAEETGAPVVLSCTGATASRNYVPGLTEAYYRHLPILAVTSTQHLSKVGNYVAQVIDRTEQYPDMVKLSIQLPTIYSSEDRERTITSINNALLELKHNIPGPVHINLTTTYNNDFSIKKLPEYRTIKRVQKEEEFPKIPMEGKIGVFIGAHEKIEESLSKSIDIFCKKHNAVVICDHTSNYRGKYRVLANIISNQSGEKIFNNFSLIIHIGYVSGAYIQLSTNQVWRVNKDGVVRDLFKKLTYVFEMDEEKFFNYYSFGNDRDDSFLNQCRTAEKKLRLRIGELPFSNIWIASQTSQCLLENSVLHLAILNSLRSWNFFETPKTVECYSNTGGFGIDGCVSSFLGAASTNTEKEFYGIFGDLAFFYDINSLVNPLPKNIHIMVINNGVGTEFKNYNHRAAQFGQEANLFIAASGHNGPKSRFLIKMFAENLGLKYLSASSKEEYNNVKNEWIKISEKGVVLEIFTNDKDESDALKMMNSLSIDKKLALKEKLKKVKLFRMIKKLMRRH